MIIKIIPELSHERRTLIFDCFSFEINEDVVESWEKAQNFYAIGQTDGALCFGGQKHMYPAEPARDEQPIMRIVLDGHLPSFREIRLIGVVWVFVMNDRGKTVDKYFN